MKLLQILARELEEWPEDVSHLVCSAKKELFGTKGGAPGFDERDKVLTWTILSGCGQSVTWQLHGGIFISQKPSDYSTAIVTREMWESERAKLKAPKANGDGWIRHRGGKCPVDAGTLVDVRYRGAQPGVDGYSRNGKKAGSYHWRHDAGRGDIMAYRIHKPAEQPDEHDLTSLTEKAGIKRMAAVASEVIITSGPLEWRLRISEIDKSHAALGSERKALIEKLASVGLAIAPMV